MLATSHLNLHPRRYPRFSPRPTRTHHVPCVSGTRADLPRPTKASFFWRISLLGHPDHPAQTGSSLAQSAHPHGLGRTLADLLRANRTPSAPAPPLRGPSLSVAPSTGGASSARPAPAALPGMALADILRAASVPARGSPLPHSSPGIGSALEAYATPASDAPSRHPSTPGPHPSPGLPVTPPDRLEPGECLPDTGDSVCPPGYAVDPPASGTSPSRPLCPPSTSLPPPPSGKLRLQRRSRHLPSGTAPAIQPALTPSQGIQLRLACILSPRPILPSFSSHRMKFPSGFPRGSAFFPGADTRVSVAPGRASGLSACRHPSGTAPPVKG